MTGIDDVDAAILAALQDNGRLSVAELGRLVSMSHSAVTERVRRLEERGVVAGYTAVVDPREMGYSIMAFLRLRYPSSRYEPLHRLLAEVPEVVEAHHVTGDDCFVMKVQAASMRHLEQVAGRIGALGSVTTSVVYSSVLDRRALPPAPATAPR